MSGLFSDTHPRMEALQIELLRNAPPARKMEMLAQLNASARRLALSGLHSRDPQASEAELRGRLADLLLGEELARKVYGECHHAGRGHPEAHQFQHPPPRQYIHSGCIHPAPATETPVPSPTVTPTPTETVTPIATYRTMETGPCSGRLGSRYAADGHLGTAGFYHAL